MDDARLGILTRPFILYRTAAVAAALFARLGEQPRVASAKICDAARGKLTCSLTYQSLEVQLTRTAALLTPLPGLPGRRCNACASWHALR